MTYSETESDGTRLRRSVTRLPADLPVVLGVVFVFDLLVFSPVRVPAALRVAVAVVLTIFLPGYALLTLLFPTRRDPDDSPALERAVARETVTSLRHRNITWVERMSLSVGASVALLPLLAVSLSVAGVPLTVEPLVAALSGVIVVLMLLGGLRRWRLPPATRFELPVRRWSAELGASTVGNDRRFDAVLNLALLVMVVVALSGFAYALTATPQGDPYSEAALLTETGETRLLANYPETLVTGESRQLTLRVENHEGRTTTYTAFVVFERVRTPDEAPVVVERAVIEQLQLTVPDGAVRYAPHTIQPELFGTDLRLSYYLYTDTPPDTPRPETADQHLFVWMDVQPRYESNASSGATATNTSNEGGTGTR